MRSVVTDKQVNLLVTMMNGRASFEAYSRDCWRGERPCTWP